MKYVPRAEISTIQDILYPLRKKKDPTWDRKNLQDLKELKQKVMKQREEKQKELENKPEPFKLKQFQNIPSKFLDTEDWIMKKQKRESGSKEKNEKIYIKNSCGRHQPNISNILHKDLNRSASIRKLPQIKINNKNLSTSKLTKNTPNINNINNESINELIHNYNTVNTNNNIDNPNNNIFNANNNINNGLNSEKELEKIPPENLEGPSIFERPMSNGEEIERLINDYKQKYGDTEVLESLLKEYNEIKQKRKAIVENDSTINNENNKIKEENHFNNYSTINYNNMNINDDLKEYEPYDENGENKKPQIPTIEDTPIILPKINKNYVKENIDLIVNNKIPQKKYIDNSNMPEVKHKNYGKVPEYIKKFEKERELAIEERKRRKEEMKYPKGTKLLSEEERVKTLRNLIKSQHDMNVILERMPVTNRSFIMQKRRDELMKKLIEIDRAIEMFSKKKVFIRK